MLFDEAGPLTRLLTHRPDEPDTPATAVKGAKEAPVLQQIPDFTPFTAPPVRDLADMLPLHRVTTAVPTVRRWFLKGPLGVQGAAVNQVGAGVLNQTATDAWGGVEPAAAAGVETAAAPAVAATQAAAVGEVTGTMASVPGPGRDTVAVDGSAGVPQTLSLIHI